MFKNNETLLNDFSKTRNLKDISKQTYSYSIKLYCEFNDKSFPELIKEAEMEENQRIRWKYRTIKKRLINFRNYLTRKYKKNYVKSTFQRIITVYKHYEIEIHSLPKQSEKNYNEPLPITYEDLPTKRIIKEAVMKSDPLMSSIILFMSSSGCARCETLNLTIKDLINATKEYHNSDNIYEVIADLEDKNNIIPIFKIRRQKTNKYFHTFCSPQATREILKYLKTKDNLKNTDRIFNIPKSTFNKKFMKLNNEMELGKIGQYNRFRSHMLRKFHATNLKNDGMSLDDVNAMQGKSKKIVDEAYFFENPKKLREKYIKHLPALTI